MKPVFFGYAPLLPALLLVIQGPVVAQLPKPEGTAPRPPVHKPEQSALNRLKQDDRSKKQLEEAIEKLREAAKRNETANKELQRIDGKDFKEDPAGMLEAMKDQISPETSADLKSAMGKVLKSEEAKKIIEEAKKKAAASIKSKSTPTTTPPEKFGPSTFDKVPTPVPSVPEPVTAKRRTPGFFVNGDSIIFPPTRDPAHPDKPLPPSDPRTRTYVVIGNAQVKTPNMVLEGDRIEMIANADGGGITPSSQVPKPAKGKAGDPVVPGAGEEKKPAPFERVIATGRVNIVRIENGKTQSGKGGSMIYDQKSGNMVLTDWPEAQEGNNVIVGTRKDAKIVLVPNGKSYNEGCTLRDLGEPKAPKSKAAGPPAAPRAQPVQ